jgi:hypothetical protein
MLAPFSPYFLTRSRYSTTADTSWLISRHRGQGLLPSAEAEKLLILMQKRLQSPTPFRCEENHI